MPIGSAVGFDLRNERMMIDTADVVTPKIPLPRHKEGTFATISIVHDGNFYRVDEFYFFGGVRTEEEGESYPRPIVRDIANMFASLIDGRASHFIPSGRPYDPSRKPAHNVFSPVYAFSYVAKKMQPFKTSEEASDSVVDNVVGYIDFVRSSALLARNRFT